jgi:hypothetical protein
MLRTVAGSMSAEIYEDCSSIILRNLNNLCANSLQVSYGKTDLVGRSPETFKF